MITTISLRIITTITHCSEIVYYLEERKWAVITENHVVQSGWTADKGFVTVSTEVDYAESDSTEKVA